MLICLALVWYITGIAGFVYWWTKDYDLTTSTAVLSLGMGIMGIMTWVVGAAIHGNPRAERVWIRRRK